MNTSCVLRCDRPDSDRARSSLRRREKQLNFLYGLEELVDQNNHQLDRILQGVVQRLPAACSCPESCWISLRFRDRIYSTPNLREAACALSAPILVAGQAEGRIDVLCLQNGREGQALFLAEERALLRAVALRVGRAAERIETEQRLQRELVALGEAKAAIGGVLRRMEEEKREIQASVAQNVERIVLPMMDALERAIPFTQRHYTSLLRKQLTEIAAPFLSVLAKQSATLTPSEIQVCDLIRNGYSTKQIARIRGVTPATIKKQREQIRRKLLLSGRQANLATYLSSLVETPALGNRGGSPDPTALVGA